MTTQEFTEQYGTEDDCPRAPYPAPADRRHRPDWDNVTLQNDGNGEVFVDVVCVNCGRSGCLGRLLINGTRIDW